MNVTLPLHRHALAQPGKPALIGERQTLTYRQLDQLVWRGASYFRSAGLSAGDRVVLRVADPVLHVVTSLALARLGVAYIALTPAEGPLMGEQLAKRIGACAAVAQSGTPEMSGCAAILVGPKSFTASRSSRRLMCDDREQFWIFRTTSGTTAKPKLLAASHAGWPKYLRTLELALPTASSDIFLSLTMPQFFVTTALHLEVLHKGATMAVPSAVAPESALNLMKRAQVSRVFAVSSSLQSLLQLPGAEPVIAALSVVNLGASAVPHRLREQVLRLTPGLVVILACGEMGMLTSTRGMQGRWLRDTVGYPVPYGRMEIVGDGGQKLAAGEVGEIRVQRDAIVKGYFDEPDADRRFFREGWFHPGDLACWTADGQVLFKGRADDMMIFHGVNIFPAEIENCLNEHPAVAEAISFPLPAGTKGEMPAAAVRVRTEVAESELVAFCQERLGMRYPRRVLIVDDFPRNAMGKPLKRAMADLVAHGAPAVEIA
jgi:acyl-coenzyme A synthetase/AMP-(fatty) acid ligase